MKKLSTYFLAGLLTFATISCSNDSNSNDDSGMNNETPSYVVAATPVALEGVADYLLTTENLSEGSISLLGNGIEQDGTYRYYITNNNKFFSLLYGQGNPGAVTTYELDGSGTLSKTSDFQSETVQSFTNVGKEVLMTKISRNSDSPYANWFRLNTENAQFVGQGQINTAGLAPEGEQAFFTWMTQVGDKVYAPFMSVKACCNDKFGTNFPDQAWVAVFSYPEMELDTIIHDDRTSFIGRYFRSGLEVAETGDIYTFSSGVASSNGELATTKHSAVTRIKSGKTSFDKDFYMDLEELSGGYYETTQQYAGNGKFLVFMNPIAKKEAYVDGKRLAIVNVYDQTFNWISGMPSEENITNVTFNNYTAEDGNTIYTGITTNEGSFVYKIDVNNASAAQGIEVEGGNITAISKLDPAQK